VSAAGAAPARAFAPVLIDARAAVRRELGGVERWARELSRRLPALRPDRYAVARPPAALSHRAGHAWEQTVLPLRARSAALLLGPANVAPVAFPRNVVVIHDAAVLREPGWYSPAYARWHGALLPAIARGARRVITVSTFSARELRDLTGVGAAVVPGGVDARFRPGADPGPARAALGLDRPYVLTVGSRIARKNLAALGVAAARLCERGIDLVAAGGGRPQFRGGPGGGAPSGWRAGGAPAAGAPDGSGPGHPVRDLGPVPDAHLPGLYAGARAFVLPSLYEGFGLPCLEAMACGTPVVAARAAALPETCGDAALYADPRDPAAIADAIDAALGEETARRLRAAGPRHAAAFTWERTARGVDAVIGEVLAGPGARAA
jgi:glycosyltransferase involved in cell wall biosynthesis